MTQPAQLQVTVQAEEIAILIGRAQGGDLTVLPELRTLLDTRKDLWEEVGDLAAHAEMSFLRLIAGNNLYAMEATQRKLDELKEELAGPSPTPLETLLIDRIGVCWLQVAHADLDAASARQKDGGGSSLSLYAQKRLDSAHKRYLYAIRQLATVRRLMRRVSAAPVPRSPTKGKNAKSVRRDAAARETQYTAP